MSSTQHLNPCSVMILAAGLGKRMCSPLPKVLHELNGKPLLFHVLKQVKDRIPLARVAIVVGHGREQVEAYVRQELEFSVMDIEFIFQPEQRGTGHAARCVMDSNWGTEVCGQKLPILVLPGDLPLLSGQLVEEMVLPLKKTEVFRLLTCELAQPTGYGRVLRKGKMGTVLRIVEEKDANTKEKAIREVAASIYFFQPDFLRKGLRGLSTNNAQGEYYLTDLMAHASRQKRKSAVLTWKNAEDLRGVNDQWELAQAGRLMNERIIRSWAMRGVKFIDPSSNQLDTAITLAEGIIIHPGAHLLGKTRIDAGTVVGARVVLTDMTIGKNVYIKTGTIAEQSEIHADASVGPYAHLRPGSVVGARTKIGNFVELKKTRIAEDSSVAHLSYLGDAEVGKHVNIGCGFVTCNFDGRVKNGSRKHKTIIEDDVFLGSDCQTIAPVVVGKGAYVASGSTITQDVPEGALAIARSKQVNKLGYAQRLKSFQNEGGEK